MKGREGWKRGVGGVGVEEIVRKEALARWGRRLVVSCMHDLRTSIKEGMSLSERDRDRDRDRERETEREREAYGR
jgi:hypothetical protein